MKTYQDRMKSYIVLLIMFAVAFILMSLLVGKSHAGQLEDAAVITAIAEQNRANSIEGINRTLKLAMNRANRISYKHFGIKALHAIYVKDSTLFVDMASAGLDLYKASRDSVINMTVDNFTIGFEEGMAKMGIKAITVMVDGKVYNTYTF